MVIIIPKQNLTIDKKMEKVSQLLLLLCFDVLPSVMSYYCNNEKVA